MGKELPNSCIECKEADCMGYCKRLEDRQEDYALKRHKDCPLEGKIKLYDLIQVIKEPEEREIPLITGDKILLEPNKMLVYLEEKYAKEDKNSISYEFLSFLGYEFEKVGKWEV